MKTIVGPRRSGKTFKSIKLANEEGGTLVVATLQQKLMLQKQGEENPQLKLNHEPIVFSDLIRNPTKFLGLKKPLLISIDEIELCLTSITPGLKVLSISYSPE